MARLGALMLAFALMGAGAARAEVANTADVISQATVLVAQGRQDGCGMQFAGRDQGYAWDLDLKVQRGASMGQLVGSVKAELARVPAAGTRVPLKVRDAWFLQEGTPFSKPAGPGAPGEGGLSWITSYESGVVLKALADAANNESPNFLVGIQVESEDATRVYRFSPKVTPSDAMEFIHCASALINQEMGKTARGR